MNIIEKSAKYILENKLNEDIILVFPSRRSAVYFKYYILKLNNNIPIMLPKIFSISEFIEYYSNMDTMDINEASVILYQIYKKMGGEDSFESFFHLGKIILKDFADIDRMIINENEKQNIFKNLKEISLIEQRDVIKNKIVKKHIKSMEEYAVLYDKFSQYIEKNRKCYSGMCYKYAYQNIVNIKHNMPEIFFIGFNALTNVEKNIFYELQKIKKAYFIWDSDKLIEEDKDLSGYFIKNNIEEFRPIINYDNLLNNKKNINIISTSINTDMTLIMKNILQKKYEENINVNDIGVILMDENILNSVMYALPTEYKEFNITMGSPIKHTGVYEILKVIFEMHIYKLRTNANGFYIKYLNNIINNPYIVFYLKNKGMYENIIEYIMHEKDNGNFEIAFPQDIINGIDFVLSNFSDKNNLIKSLIIFLNEMSELYKGSVEKNYILYIKDTIIKIEKAFDLINDIKIDTILNIILSILESLRIPFKGEPIKGLQIMGLLESRLLSFKYLIILSANDNFLPGKSDDMSLIPKDIKRKFNIFSNKEKDAIFAYYFFRLLKYANNVDIIYAEQTDSKIGVSMRSRFIDYIMWNNNRHKGIGNNWNINNYVFYNNNIVKKQARTQDKTKTIINELKKIKFSPTSLINYLKCPYRFYLSEVLKIRKDNDYEEDMDRGVFGIIIHSVLQYLYEQYKEKVYMRIKKDDWNEYYIQLCEKVIKENDSMPDFNIKTGRNRMMIDAGRILIENIINKEKEIINVDYTKEFLFEEKIDNIKLQCNDFEVYLKGIIDRKEENDKECIIVDYKTGSVKNTNFKFKDDWEEQKNEIINKKEAFQLFFYLFLIYKQKNEDKIYKAYNYFLSKNDIKPLKINGSEEIGEKEFLDFENILIKIIKEIFDENKSFVAIETTPSNKYSNCQYCEFESICKIQINIKK